MESALWSAWQWTSAALRNTDGHITIAHGATLHANGEHFTLVDCERQVEVGKMEADEWVSYFDLPAALQELWGAARDTASREGQLSLPASDGRWWPVVRGDATPLRGKIHHYGDTTFAWSLLAVESVSEPYSAAVVHKKI